MKDLSIRRGDTKGFYFRRTKDGEPIQQEAQSIYFTVKKSSKLNEVVFQKTLDDMDFDEEYFYHLIVNPEDTNGLQYGDYVYDVEVKIENYVKTIAIGKFTIKNEVTFVGNEV